MQSIVNAWSMKYLFQAGSTLNNPGIAAGTRAEPAPLQGRGIHALWLA